MQHNFGDFLRHGGEGQYLIARRGGRIFGQQAGWSVKSAFPEYSALVADFGARLDQLVADNTLQLLNALTPPDSVPVITEADLLDVSDARVQTIEAWDARLTSILTQYESHPQAAQRLRTQRVAMEERLLRGFAGLINQLRQEALGFTHYVWRSQEDGKVRDHHAARNGQIFRWADAPEGGHPGEDYNCRCFAEPVPSTAPSNLILADFAATAGGLRIDPTDALRGLRALTPTGLALIASEKFQEMADAMRDRRVIDAGDRLGVDLTTVEGRLAATAYALVQEGISGGVYPVLPKSSEFARIGAEAAALFELLNPGSILETGIGGDPDTQRALQDFIEAAGEAYESGDLRLQDGELAQGWVETFPTLTEDELRLGELPGFAQERLDQWLETYPADALGVPDSTIAPLPDDPSSNIVSTPAAQETEPNVVAREIGSLAAPEGQDLPSDFDERSNELSNENGVLRPREGRAGARYETASGTRLARPDPADPAYDFVDTSNGDRIEVKGPVPGVNGVVPDERLEGLIEATVEEANMQTGADRIVVDAEGLSSLQVDRLRRELENRISSDIPVDIMR